MLAGNAVQRFDFLVFFFFLAAFLPAFLADFLAEDFFAAFLDFFAAFFFGATFFAAFFFFLFAFLTAGLAAIFGGSAGLLIAAVVGSRTGFSSSISSPRFYRSNNDSGFCRGVKVTTA
ncbi:MAG: hypothetical protein ACXWKP_18150 [Bradyrhizobium sp.]